jgi:hypothetical protein
MARQLTIEISVEANRAKDEARQLEQGLKNLEQAALKAGGATDKQAAAHENLSRRLADAKMRASELEKEKRKLTSTVDSAAKSTGFLTNAVMRFASGIAIGAAIKGAIDYADSLKDISDATGIAASTLAKMDKVAITNGSNIQKLSGAMLTLQDRVAGGDKSAARALEKLGTSFTVLNAMKPERQMEYLAQKLSGVKDQGQAVTIAVDLFGKAGGRLLPTLRDMADGLDKINGPSEKAIQNASALADKWELMKANLSGGLITDIDNLHSLFEKLRDTSPRAASGLAMISDPLYAIGRAMKFINEQKEWAQRIGRQGATAANAYLDPLGLQLPGGVARGRVPGAPDLAGAFGGGPQGYAAFDEKETLRIQTEIMEAVKKTDAYQQNALENAKKASEAAKEAAEAAYVAWTHTFDKSRQALSGAELYVNASWQGMEGSVFNQIRKTSNVYWTNQIGNGMATSAMPAIQGMNNPFAYYSQQPSRFTNIMRGMNGAQAGWRAQNFGSAEGWMNSAYGWGEQLQDISEHGDPLVNATNVRGRGRRAVAGALKGAELGGRFGGPYGAAGGALVGLIVGAFRNPAFEDVWNRIAKNFGVEVSDELAKSIADRAKREFKNDRQAAEVASLSSIISEGGGLNADNIGLMTERFRDAFALKGGGKFDQKQLNTVFNENFDSFAGYSVSTGKLATTQFQELIKLAKEFKVESEPLKDFIYGQSSAVGDGLAAMLGPVVEEALEIGGAVAEAKGQVDALTTAGQQGTDEYAAAVQRLNELQAQQAVEAGLVAGDIENIGVVALAAFNQARDAGLSFSEAIDAISPALDALAVAQEGFGVVSDNAAIKQLVHYRELAEAHKPLMAAADGLNETMLALSHIGGLNVETLAAMEDQGMRTFNRLIDAGFTEQEALSQMGGFLESIIESHQRLGVPIDANTQALIDQAQAQGLLKDEALSTNNILMDGIGALITALGGDLPEAWQKAAEAAENMATTAPPAMDDTASGANDVEDALVDMTGQLNVEPWSEWAGGVLSELGRVEDAVNAVSFGHSPGGLKEFPIKLQEAIDAAREFKDNMVREMGIVEDTVNGLTDEQQEAIRLFLEIGKPISEIATLMDLSTAALDRFIAKEEEAAQAARDMANAMAQQHENDRRGQASLADMVQRMQDDIALMGKTGLDRELLQLEIDKRGAIAELEALRPFAGYLVDDALKVLNEKYRLLEEQARNRVLEGQAGTVRYPAGTYNVPVETQLSPLDVMTGVKAHLYAEGGVVLPFQARGTDTVPAMLTPGEGVITRRGMRALDRINQGGAVGGPSFSITINASSREGGREAAEAFVEEMRRRGIKLAS